MNKRTYQEFRDKYKGKYVDTDNFPKDWKWQCFDLGQLYVTECLGLPSSILAGCDFVKNMILWDWKRNLLLQYFDEVSVYEMIPGDLCIWTYGEGGHIAIYDHWDGSQNWFFSQNPNPCEVMVINMPELHAFRVKKKEEPKPKPEITPNVKRDEYKNQIEVIVDNLRVRTKPNTNAEALSRANKGFYNYYETYKKDNNDYTWYKIADNQWIASSDEWTKVYPAKKDEYKQLKVLDKKDGYVLIDLGQVWIKED